MTMIAKIIEMDKDFDAAWIKEMIVSRVNICDIPAIISELEPHVSANDPNGAKFAISALEKCNVC